MNTRPIIDDSAGPAALSASFNFDNSCFSVAHESGFRVYLAEKCELVKSRNVGAGIGCAEMVEKTKYVALVGGGRQPRFPQNKVVIWNDATQTPVITMEFRTSVLGVRLCRTHIIVILLNSVNLYKFSQPPEKIAVYETANNPFGLCCLGSKTFAFPGRTPGHVQLVELATRNVSIISAHTAPLRALALSPDGAVLATASETGTLARIWATAQCTRIGELRRGVDPATVFSMAISPNSSLLAVTSDKSTLHIFDLPHPARPMSWPSSSSSVGNPENGDANSQNKWGMLGKLPLMPRVFSDTYSFASAHFDIGDEPAMWQHGGRNANTSATYSAPIPGVPGGRPPKGIVGWVSDEELVVLGAGQDARWQKFIVGPTSEGKRVCVRQGWKRYLDL